MVAAFNAAHPHEPPITHEFSSRGKAGWVEGIERERGPAHEEKLVTAFIDDRANNRIAAMAAGKLGQRMIVVKSVLPGTTYSQQDEGSRHVISTFDPNPGTAAP
jgi:hypothetical protein